VCCVYSLVTGVSKRLSKWDFTSLQFCWKARRIQSSENSIGPNIIWCTEFALGNWMREYRKAITFGDIDFVRAL
jgi:hypothetical protein